MLRMRDGYLRTGFDVRNNLAEIKLDVSFQPPKPAQRGKPPRLLPPGRNIETHQPTDPSIWSSIRRLSSSAYSIGSSLAMGSTKPRTIVAIASSSVMPRLIR